MTNSNNLDAVASAGDTLGQQLGLLCEQGVICSYIEEEDEDNRKVYKVCPNKKDASWLDMIHWQPSFFEVWEDEMLWYIDDGNGAGVEEYPKADWT